MRSPTLVISHEDFIHGLDKMRDEKELSEREWKSVKQLAEDCSFEARISDW